MSTQSIQGRARRLVFEWMKLMGDDHPAKGAQVLENRIIDALIAAENKATERAISVFLDHEYDAAVAILRGEE